MKKTIGSPLLSLSLFFLIALTTVRAQDRKLDSLKQQVAHSKSDTAASRTLWKIAQRYFDQHKAYDSTLLYAAQGYELAKKHEFLMGMWVNLAEQCMAYQVRGNHQKALTMYLDFLKLCEEKKDLQITTRVLNFISDLYLKLGDYGQAIAYSKKNTPFIIESRIGDSWLLNNLHTIGLSFIQLNQSDSALAYFQQAFALVTNDKSGGLKRGGLELILVGLGMANEQLGNDAVALAYFDQAIEGQKKYAYAYIERYYAYMQKAKLLLKLNKTDSSVANYETALQLVYGNFNDQVFMYKALANIFLAKDPAKAVKYFSLEQKLRDSLFSSEKINAIQTLTYNEQERQKQVADAQKEEAKTHKKNIENVFIAIGIISFLILFLLLSRSIIVNEKWIRFLGIVGLLLLFEFINLLLHPLVEKFTHHSSVYMLFIMVGIAALLVPLHHRIEKWVTTRMVEKNKQVRLAAAKRTIEKLGGEPDTY